ncbi:hypothetical protein GMORB2_7300 [Geosmithia morbida]|uniref:Uncharacterized protein n=1 Tax=Geosmithia morbida TaxID=1094350 RepID=A0A9P4YV83_9HYPO|nr:uncharacterized protein GMORB2_7300 [Geosmithia morbida]KAF4122308.1 hypothetical protein GMORB2_7300 [Geosmithia morbida]
MSAGPRPVTHTRPIRSTLLPRKDIQVIKDPLVKANTPFLEIILLIYLQSMNLKPGVIVDQALLSIRRVQVTQSCPRLIPGGEGGATDQGSLSEGGIDSGPPPAQESVDPPPAKEELSVNDESRNETSLRPTPTAKGEGLMLEPTPPVSVSDEGEELELILPSEDASGSKASSVKDTRLNDDESDLSKDAGSEDDEPAPAKNGCGRKSYSVKEAVLVDDKIEPSPALPEHADAKNGEASLIKTESDRKPTFVKDQGSIDDELASANYDDASSVKVHLITRDAGKSKPPSVEEENAADQEPIPSSTDYGISPSDESDLNPRSSLLFSPTKADGPLPNPRATRAQDTICRVFRRSDADNMYERYRHHLQSWEIPDELRCEVVRRFPEPIIHVMDPIDRLRVGLLARAHGISPVSRLCGAANSENVDETSAKIEKKINTKAHVVESPCPLLDIAEDMLVIANREDDQERKCVLSALANAIGLCHEKYHSSQTVL